MSGPDLSGRGWRSAAIRREHGDTVLHNGQGISCLAEELLGFHGDLYSV